MLSKSSLLMYTHRFEVKNTRGDAVQLQVSEQVPLSTDERIKVMRGYSLASFQGLCTVFCCTKDTEGLVSFLTCVMSRV